MEINGTLQVSGVIPEAGNWGQGLDDNWEESLGQVLALGLGLGVSSTDLYQLHIMFLGKIFLYQAVALLKKCCGVLTSPSKARLDKTEGKEKAKSKSGSAMEWL